MKKILRQLISSFGYEYWRKDDIANPIAYNTVNGANDFYSNPVLVDVYVKNEVLNIIHNNLFALKENSIDLNNKSLLDAGFGTGHFLKKVLEKFPTALAEGTEISSVAINAGEKLLPRVKLSLLDIEKGHLDKTFDVVCCSHVLEHLQHPEKALENLMAMVRKDGILFIAVPDGRLDHFGGHIHYWGVASLPLMLKKTLPNNKIITGRSLDGNNLYAIIYQTC